MTYDSREIVYQVGDSMAQGTEQEAGRSYFHSHTGSKYVCVSGSLGKRLPSQTSSYKPLPPKTSITPTECQQLETKFSSTQVYRAHCSFKHHRSAVCQITAWLPLLFCLLFVCPLIYFAFCLFILLFCFFLGSPFYYNTNKETLS